MLADDTGTPVEIRVIEVDENPPNQRLTHRMMVEDQEGQRYQFKIWGKNDAHQGWEVDRWYEISNYGLRKDANPPLLQSMNIMEVEPAESPNEELTIAIIGDTHLGYKKRNNKITRNRRIDCVGAFRVAVSVITTDIRPDVTVHTGDILDDDAGRPEAMTFARGVDWLNDFGPVYYVRGNHGNQTALSALTEETSEMEFEHLGWEGTYVSDDVLLFGVDRDDSLRRFVRGSPSNEAETEICVFHHNVKDKNGDFSENIRRKGHDAYVVGHYHDPSKFERREVDTHSEEDLVLYTGPIDGISKNSSYSNWYDQNPSVWELRIKGGTMECIRHSLVPKIGLER